MAFSQFVYEGRVIGKPTKMALPGVNVILETDSTKVTNQDGRFSFESSKPRITATFSFIGLQRITLELETGDNGDIEMDIDSSSDFLIINAKIKTIISAGYYGDVVHAPIGLKFQADFQSIGNLRLETNTSFAYANYDRNKIIEIAINKSISLPVSLPSNLLLSYKKMDYRRDQFNIEQFRGYVEFNIWRNVSLDVGAVLNRTDVTKFTSAHLGASLMFPWRGLPSIEGIITYNTSHLIL
jgi:hypothetical protein